MTIERIVRPFETGNVFTARVLPPDPPPIEAPDPVIVTWEGKADTHYEVEPEPTTMGFTAEFSEVESRRITETVRVSNPDDASQFVDVERYKQATFKNNLTGHEQTFSFAGVGAGNA